MLPLFVIGGVTMPKRTKEEQQALDKEYAKELRKLKRRVRDISKRGYSIPSTIIPKKPQTINPESIENIRKRDTKYIYKRSVYVSPEGTIIKGTERRTQERHEAALKAAETKRINFYKRKNDEWANDNQSNYESEYNYSYDPAYEKYIVFMTVYEDFEQWTPSDWWSDDLKKYKQRDRDRGWGILQGAINELGEDAVADNLNANAVRVNELVSKILYESGNEYREDSRNGEINMSLNEFEAIVRGKALNIRESMELTAQAELMERHERT